MYDIQQIVSVILEHCHPAKRSLIAVAGPPASGKSTLADELEIVINQQKDPSICAVVPMDGFHLDNETLDQLNLRHRKGAPETFDSLGFLELLERLKVADTAQPIPLFDRSQDAVVPAAKVVTPEQQIILVEGNYLLLDVEPWQRLQALFDFTIFVNPGMQVLEERLLARWLQHGFTEAEAQNKAQDNDLPNARFVVEHSLTADLVLS